MEDRDFYWEHLKHEDTLFSNRTSFYLVGESILLAGVVAFLAPLQTSMDQGQQPVRAPLGPFCWAGLVIAIIWLFANLKHLLTDNRHIKAKLQDCHPAWAAIASGRRHWPSVNWVLGLVLPALFFFVWAYLWIVNASQTDLDPILKGAGRVLVIVGLVLNIAGVVVTAILGLPTFPLKAFRSPIGDDAAQQTASKPWNWPSVLGLGLLLVGFVVQLVGVIIGW